MKKTDDRRNIKILPYYLERLNQIAEVDKRSQKATLEIIIEEKYEDYVMNGLIREL